MTETQTLTIAQDRLLTGLSYRELATKYNCDPSTICRNLNRDEIRDILNTGIQQQIALVPKAIDVLNDTLNDTDPAAKALRLRASETILKNTGLAPTNAPVTMINNILNITTTEVPEAIQELFRALTHTQSTHPSMLADTDVIDITPGGEKR